MVFLRKYDVNGAYFLSSIISNNIERLRNFAVLLARAIKIVNHKITFEVSRP